MPQKSLGHALVAPSILPGLYFEAANLLTFRGFMTKELVKLKKKFLLVNFYFILYIWFSIIQCHSIWCVGAIICIIIAAIIINHSHIIRKGVGLSYKISDSYHYTKLDNIFHLYLYSILQHSFKRLDFTSIHN